MQSGKGQVKGNKVIGSEETKFGNLFPNIFFSLAKSLYITMVPTLDSSQALILS